MMLILAQKTEGGYTLGSLTFTTLEEFASYCAWYFLPDNRDCIVGLVGLMGSISEAVVSHQSREPNVYGCSDRIVSKIFYYSGLVLCILPNHPAWPKSRS